MPCAFTRSIGCGSRGEIDVLAHACACFSLRIHAVERQLQLSRRRQRQAIAVDLDGHRDRRISLGAAERRRMDGKGRGLAAVSGYRGRPEARATSCPHSDASPRARGARLRPSSDRQQTAAADDAVSPACNDGDAWTFYTDLDLVKLAVGWSIRQTITEHVVPAVAIHDPLE